MRMSRGKRRRLNLQRRRERMHCRKKAAAALLTGLAAGAPLRADAVTLNVLQDIYGDFDYMENNLANIRAFDLAKEYVGEAAKNAALAQSYLEEAEGICREAAGNLRMAEENRQQAEEQVRLTAEELQKTRAERIRLTEQAVASQQAVADYLPVWYEAQAELQQRLDVQQAAALERPAEAAAAEDGGLSLRERQRAEWIEAAWEEAGFENSRLPELEMRFAASAAAGSTGDGADGLSEAQAAIDAYWARMEQLEAEADAAREYFDSVSERLDELKEQCQEAEEAEADCRRDVLELERELARNEQDVLDCQQDVAICQNEQAEANKACFQALLERNDSFEAVIEAKASLLHLGDGSGAQNRLGYYSWQGAAAGHQLYDAYSCYWAGYGRELSISNAYVYSHTGLADGEMSGLTDTTVSAMYANKHPVYDVRYGLDVNLPTGESRMHDNAVVPDYLAPYGSLGEGWNFTPRLEVARHVDKYTAWTWRSAYAFRGSYANSWDDPASVVHPGSIWSNELEYLHTDEARQYMVKLQYTKNSRSSMTGAVNNYSFTEGDGMAGRGYFRSWFTKLDSWAVYSAWSYDRAAAYDDAAMGGAGVHRLYYGGGWFHRFDDRRQLRLFANWLRAEGAAYDPLTRQSYSSGRRFSVSLGYDWRLDDRNSLSLDVERAVMRQQGDANYRGWGVMMSYNRSF